MDADPKRRRNAAWSRRFLARCGLPIRADLVEQAGQFRRSSLVMVALFPVLVAWIVLMNRLLGPQYPSGSQTVINALTVPFIATCAAALAPVPVVAGSVRSASLVPRRVTDLIPAWLAALPFVATAPSALSLVWLLLVPDAYPVGHAVFVTGMVLIGLATYVLPLRKVLGMRLQTTDASAAHLDLVLRALTVKRSALRISGLGFLMFGALNARPGAHVDASNFSPLGWVALACALACVPLADAVRVPPKRFRAGPDGNRIVAPGAYA